jgi:hypothetical protein
MIDLNAEAEHAEHSAHADHDAIDLGEAQRELEQAVHDARVAFDCIGLGEMERALTHAITARAAIAAAENVLRTYTKDDGHLADDIDI